MVWIKLGMTSLNLSNKGLTLAQLKQLCDELAVLPEFIRVLPCL
jgi:hypothetical protein